MDECQLHLLVSSSFSVTSAVLTVVQALFVRAAFMSLLESIALKDLKDPPVAVDIMRTAALCSLVAVGAHVAPVPNAFPNSQHLLFETVKSDAEGVVMEVTSGEFPSWLQGTKYNNGFGQFESCPAKGDCWYINHLADVMSYYSKVEVANGTVRLWSKIQKTTYWQEAQSKKPLYRTFNGTTPGYSLVEEAEAKVNMKPNDNLNVAILQLTTSGRMFGVSDMKGFNEATDKLDYAGLLSFKEENKPMLGIDMVTCAHVGNTLGDKYVYGFNYLLVDGLKNDLAVWRVDMTQQEDGTGSQIVREWMDTMKVPGLTHISYIHTFANTENFLVFVGSAFQYNIDKIIANTKILNAMEWHGEKNNMVWV